MTETDGVVGDVEDGLSDESVYGFLADKRRRYALHYLKQRGEPVTVRELAERVAAWENDKPVDALTSQERKRVYIALYQSHLPSMDGEGIVDYDEEASTVSLAAPIRSMDVYMEVVPQDDVPWSLFYVGLAVANAVLVLLAWGDVRPFSQVPDLGWAAVAILTFGVSALVQTYANRRMRFGDDGPPPELQGRE